MPHETAASRLPAGLVRHSRKRKNWWFDILAGRQSWDMRHRLQKGGVCHVADLLSANYVAEKPPCRVSHLQLSRP